MNAYLKLLSLLLFMCLILPIVSAQSKKEIRKENRANRKANTVKLRSPLVVYPVYTSIQDTRATPGIYSNLGFGLALRGQTHRPKFTFENSFDFNIGIGSPNFDDGALMYNIVFLGETNYIRPINEDFSVGAQLYINQHNRLLPSLVNSSYNMDFVIGLGPIGRWNKTFNLFKKETNLAISVTVPLVSNVVRVPEFGLSFSGFSNTVAPIGQFNRISIRLDATRLFKKSAENKVNYFYKWDYYGMREFDGLHNLRVASHHIGFHLWIKRN